jgi:hypothetical protein
LKEKLMPYLIYSGFGYFEKWWRQPDYI